MIVAVSMETEPVEAVIISGPRKGEFIRVSPESEEMPELTPAVEELLEQMAVASKRMAENAHAAVVEADGLLQDLRRARGKQP